MPHSTQTESGWRCFTLAPVKRRGKRQEKQRERERLVNGLSPLSDGDKELSDKNGKKGGMDGEKVEG